MTIISLWLPILLSAIAVFLVSSIIHMILSYHSTNFSKLPNEEKFLNDVGALDIPPGEYMYPFCSGNKEMQSVEYLKKINLGPVGMMTAMPKGPFAMGKNLSAWFIYSILIGIYSAYIALLALPETTEYLSVMRVVSTAAFGGYSLALIQNSVWYSRSWRTTMKFMFDGLVYALITGGIFGWLWN